MIFKTDKDRNNAYRNTFFSNEGKLVLVDILDVLHFWDTVMPPSLSEVEQNALNLCAKNILARAGFWESENIVGTMLRTIDPKKDQVGLDMTRKQRKWYKRIWK